MIVRTLEEVEKTENFVEWGRGTSHRMLVSKDNMGFTLCHTVVNAGSESILKYERHLEACYCIAGQGELENLQTHQKYPIRYGFMYALDKHDKHCIRVDKDQDLILVCIFNPALEGTEVHKFDNSEFSSY